MDSDNEVKLGDTALRIYLLLLRENKPLSIREVQRMLDLSSPGVAYHHLERLRRLGLVEKDTDGYRAVRRGGVVEGVVIMGSSILPRSAFYLGFMATLTASYLALVFTRLIKLDPIALVAMFAGLTFSALEFKDQWGRIRRLIRYG